MYILFYIYSFLSVVSTIKQCLRCGNLLSVHWHTDCFFLLKTKLFLNMSFQHLLQCSTSYSLWKTFRLSGSNLITGPWKHWELAVFHSTGNSIHSA
jgi:hypothetical protein